MQTELLKGQVETLRSECIGETIVVMYLWSGKLLADKGMLKAVNGFSSIEIVSSASSNTGEQLECSGSAIYTVSGIGLRPARNSTAIFSVSGDGAPFASDISPTAIVVYTGMENPPLENPLESVKKIHFVGHNIGIVEILRGKDSIYCNPYIATGNYDLAQESSIDKVVFKSFGKAVLDELVQQRNDRKKELDDKIRSLKCMVRD